jgi:signal transduction histidine kinase
MVLTWHAVSAQTNRIAALKTKISQAKNNTDKLNAIFALCEESESLHSDSLYQYAIAAGNIAVTEKNVEATRRSAYYRAYSFYHKNNLDSVSAIINENSARLKQELPDSPVIALFDLLEARYLTRKQQYKEAMAIYYHLLAVSEKKKDTLNQVRAMAGIGSIANRTHDFTGALNWFLKAIGLGVRHRDKTAYLYTNAAVLYTRADKYDSAKWYVARGIAYARQYENLGDLSSALGMYSGLLMDINEKAGATQAGYDAAEKPLREALSIAEKLGEANDIITNMISLGNFYYDTRQYRKGIAICEKAIALIGQYGIPAKLNIVYDFLARNYEALGDYQKQAETLKRVADIKDSVYEQNSAEAMSELKTKYEVQKKENTIILQQLALVKKDYLIYSSIALFILVAVISYFSFRNYKNRQKQKAALAIAIAEEGERKRLAADLHDNLGAYAASIASNVNRLADSPGNSIDTTALQEVRNNSNAIVADLSDTIWALKKESLPLTAVSDRLKVFIQRIQNSYRGVAIDVQENIITDHSLSPSQGFHLFQTLQEAINNALKHSGCSEIMIDITGMPKEWMISVRDNGSGMTGPSANSGGGNGLFNMQNRSAEAGWQIEWKNSGGGGTTVVISQDLTSIN